MAATLFEKPISSFQKRNNRLSVSSDETSWKYYDKKSKQQKPLEIQGIKPIDAFEIEGTIFAKLPDGRWFGFGENNSGVLGIGNWEPVDEPMEILIDGKSPVNILNRTSEQLLLEHPDGTLFGIGWNCAGRHQGSETKTWHSPEPLESSNFWAKRDAIKHAALFNLNAVFDYGTPGEWHIHYAKYKRIKNNKHLDTSDSSTTSLPKPTGGR